MLLKDSPLRVAAVAGGANGARQVEKIRKDRPQLLVGTAGRVRELAFEWRKLKLQSVRHLVVDEVDDALRSSNLDATVEVIQSFRDVSHRGVTADTRTVDECRPRALVPALGHPLSSARLLASRSSPAAPRAGRSKSSSPRRRPTRRWCAARRSNCSRLR